MVRTRRWGRIAAALAALAIVGCGDRASKEEAKPEPRAADKPPALAKPQGEDAPPVKAPPPETKGEDADKPATASDDEDIYDDKEPAAERVHAEPKRDGKRKRASSKHPVAPEGAAPVPLRVKRIQFAEKIEAREPVEPEETFERTDRLYAFVEIANETKKATKIVVTFFPPSGGSSKVTLDVGDKPRWRTWALRRGVKTPGTWTVVVSDEQGREIGKRTFEVTD